MPAETARHERTLMCWPARRELYGDLFEEAEEAHATVAAAIAAHEPVTMVANPGSGERATARCGPEVDVVEIPIDDSWARDTGPIYVTDGARRIALDWVFNGWGGKYVPYDRDAELARRWSERHGDEVRAVDMVLEGGSITVNGRGTLVTTAQCLLHPNRNPAMTTADIEARLRAELGVADVVWLPHGLVDDDDTDGHVDNVAAFADDPGVLVVQGCDDEGEPDSARLAANRRVAEEAGLQTIEVPVLPFAEIGARRVPVPYLNYYVINGAVVVPTCGHPADADMLAIIGAQYPGREIVALPWVGAILAYGGGGVHCITQQIPAVDAAVPVAPADTASP